MSCWKSPIIELEERRTIYENTFSKITGIKSFYAASTSDFPQKMNKCIWMRQRGGGGSYSEYFRSQKVNKLTVSFSKKNKLIISQRLASLSGKLANRLKIVHWPIMSIKILYCTMCYNAHREKAFLWTELISCAHTCVRRSPQIIYVRI